MSDGQCMSRNSVFSPSMCQIHHAPRHSHAEAVKRIARHLKGVLKAEQGLQFTIFGDFNLDLHVDADFARLWTCEDDQDAVCVKSRTGCVVTLGGCPISFSVATSTLEAECIALATTMRAFVLCVVLILNFV